jgi:predicted HAD superfamily Cof-like phosphohydrolase
MSKLVDGKVIRREDGKILKPEGWQPPQIDKIINEARQESVRNAIITL